VVESLGGVQKDSEVVQKDSEGSGGSKKKIPFVKMLTSPAIWAIFVGHFDKGNLLLGATTSLGVLLNLSSQTLHYVSPLN
jgi:hypothetical protein